MGSTKESSIFQVMREELLRLTQAEQSYLKAIEDLPRGASRIKRIRNGEYLYLVRREGSRVMYDYVGPMHAEHTRRTLEMVEKRKRLSALLKETRQALKDVRGVLRGKI